MPLTRFLNTSKPAIKMHSSDSVMDAVRKMAAINVGSVLIVRENGSLEGIFTERDLLIRVVNEGRDPGKTSLRDVMTADVVVLSVSSTLDHAINVMSKNSVRHLPLEDNNRNVVGVISLRDLLHEKVDVVIQELKILEDFDDNVPGG